MFNNIYQKALKDEKHTIRLQVFRMVLCGVPRSGKTTFWKRIAIKDFDLRKKSASTGAKSHYLSVQEKEPQKDDHKSNGLSPSAGTAESVQEKEPDVDTEMLFDLHLYREDEDLDHEALSIYKCMLENKPQPEEVHQNADQDKGKGGNGVQLADDNEKDVDNKPETRTNVNQVEAANNLLPAANSDKAQSANSKENQSEAHAASPAANQQTVVDVAKELPSDPIVTEIDKCFKELDNFLQNGKKLPDIIPDNIIKKMCHLQDIGGQKAFLQLLPTVSTGKALYLLFFNYKDFETSVPETVLIKRSSEEVLTGAAYEQMHVIMQSLICVSSTKSSDNVALLVGTHVDEFQSEDDISRVNNIIYKEVEPFLKSKNLMYAKSGGKDEERLVLKVAINDDNKLNSRNTEDYKEVVMHIVDKKLRCPKSEELPASWYMFSVILRKIQRARHPVLKYEHCERIADRLHIQQSMLKALLSKLHEVLGIVFYFQEDGLDDIVICDPGFIYKSISELIFKSFDKRTNAELSNKLTKWGMFKYENLKEHYNDIIKKDDQKYLEMNKLKILLQHLGIIAQIQNSTQHEHMDDFDTIIPCVLHDTKDLNVQIQDTQACSIVPLRIYFECGFAPMGGFCYLFTKLMSNWKLRLPKVFRVENQVYWRNKVTFEVEENYSVTLLSTDKYYEIHILHSESEKPFQLGTDGHTICKKVWKAIHTILENSPNKSLQNHITGCICTINHKEHDQHVMKFECKPHEFQSVSRVKAQCSSNQSPVTVLEAQQSVMVWFKVCISSNTILL